MGLGGQNLAFRCQRTKWISRNLRRGSIMCAGMVRLRLIGWPFQVVTMKDSEDFVFSHFEDFFSLMALLSIVFWSLLL